MKTRLHQSKLSSPPLSQFNTASNKENYFPNSIKERQIKRKKNVQQALPDPLSAYLQEFFIFSSLPQNDILEVPETNEGQITSHVRVTLLKWIVEVHKKFQFLYETFFLAIKLIDEYTRLIEVRKCDYQLLGFTCLFIAAKYQEILTPKIKSFIPICDRLFSVADVLKMEGSILTVLDFQISKPTVNWYLDFHLFALPTEGIKNKKSYIQECQYLMELCIMEWEMRDYSAKVQSLAIMHHISMTGKFLHISIQPLLKNLEKKQIKKVKNCVKVVEKVARNASETGRA